MEIEILYEDDQVLALNKPAGLLVHADGSSQDATLVDWISVNRPEIAGVGEEQRLKNGVIVDRPGIVHRLDRDTSGVILVAKTQASYDDLKNQFKTRAIKKAYLALVHGNFKEGHEKGEINLEIGRSPRDFRQYSAQPGARGTKRSAQTRYFVLEAVSKFTLVFLQPETGRTHQLRVHLKAVHHPIVCDDLYGKNNGCVKGISRQALHARAITWRNQYGQFQQITANLPSDFTQALANLGFKYKSD